MGQDRDRCLDRRPWYVGIVAFNSDFAFTVTNVVAHGLPYLALVWLYGRRKWSAPPSWRTWLYRPALLWVFVGFTILLAYLEEAPGTCSSGAST